MSVQKSCTSFVNETVFELFLKHKAAEYKKVIEYVSEAYTSKTVSWTGEILNNLGGKKVVTGIGWFSSRSRLKSPASNQDPWLVVEKFSATLEDTPSVG